MTDLAILRDNTADMHARYLAVRRIIDAGDGSETMRQIAGTMMNMSAYRGWGRAGRSPMRTAKRHLDRLLAQVA